MKIYAPLTNINDCTNLQTDLNLTNQFLNSWQLNLNIDKCEIVHIGARNNYHRYVINNSTIAVTDSVRDLGVITSNNLSSHSYCVLIARNASWRIRQLKLAFENPDIKFRTFLYIVYIRPILEYNTQIWSPYTVGDIDLIEGIQRKFTKSLFGYANLPYNVRLNRLNLQPLEIRRIFFDLILLYKIVHGLIDINPGDFFRFNTNSTRGHSLKIVIQYSRVNVRKYFFINRVAPIWNSLDESTVNSTSVHSFKEKLLSTISRATARALCFMALNEPLTHL